MGCVKNITKDTFPKQGSYLGKRMKVIFHYDSSHEIGGMIVRDDVEEPWITIIALDDGRHVMASECQYGLATGAST